MMDILKRNLEEIGKKDRALAERISNFNGECVELAPAKTGALTFRFQGRLFHSAYDPAKEAQAQAKEIISRKPDFVLLFGLGCGHLAAALIQNGVKNVLAYEPSIEILKGVLTRADLSTLLQVVELFDDIARFISRVRDIDAFENILCYSTDPYKGAFPREVVDFLNRVNNAHITSKVCVQTDIESREVWVDNYFDNIDQMVGCPPVDVLSGRFKGMPIIIAGAGPSLKKNAHLLKEVKGKAVIMAAITAYKPLLSYGVIPDFIIAAEKVDLPEYFTYDECDLKTRLILGEVAHPGMFGREVKEKFVFFNPSHALSTEHAKYWGSDYFPAVGGSVTTAALDIAVKMGGGPIIFVGQDLCFGENETHVPGGVYVSQDIKIDRDKGVVSIEEDYVTLKERAKSSHKLQWIKGLDGRPVPSKFDWVTFHQWFEDYMADLNKKGGPRVLNATEGGAYIEGMEHVTLKDAINTYINTVFSVDELVASAVAERTEPDTEGLAKSLESMQKGLKEMRKTADSILREIELVKRSVSGSTASPDALKAVGRIKRLEDKLFREAEASPFIWETLTAATCELKTYLKSSEDKAEAVLEEELKATSSSYEKVSEMCGRYAQVAFRAAGRLRGASGKASPKLAAQ
ncbi:MAG: hypothetical protein A2054_08150 [Deltaproteobacteria bacterium GWA2_55_10]|nr:MAG: hypothetical protein A2054_08150 [Deltaproteobacteria bacterium GWA2_55_10]